MVFARRCCAYCSKRASCWNRDPTRAVRTISSQLWWGAALFFFIAAFNVDVINVDLKFEWCMTYSMFVSSIVVPSKVDYVTLSGFFCGFPNGLELSPRQSRWTGHWQRQLQLCSDNVFVFNILAYLAHYGCYDDALYKWTTYSRVCCSAFTCDLFCSRYCYCYYIFTRTIAPWSVCP